MISTGDPLVVQLGVIAELHEQAGAEAGGLPRFQYSKFIRLLKPHFLSFAPIRVIRVIRGPLAP